jgi:RNA polymerase sigma factor (sigma-70 family)
MASAQLGTALQHIHRLFAEGSATGLSDGQLLERFLARRDEAAFAALFERHAAMVVAVCRRSLKDPSEMEDAFQATFLVLARRAGSVRGHEALGAWIYGVARRVCLLANRSGARRRAHELRAGELRVVSARGDDADDDPGPAIYEEIDRLPTSYRLPIVLCLLEGRTRAEAAAQLHWTEGTVRGRLARAKVMLRARLIRRGFVPAAAFAVLAREHSAVAAVPKALIEGAVRAGAVSAAVAPLSARVIRSMFMTRLRLGAIALATVGVAAWGLAALAIAPAHQADSTTTTTSPASSTPKVAAAKAADAGLVEVKGRVVDDAGKAVAGAKVALVMAPDWNRNALTTSGADGRFRAMVVREAVGGNAKLIASADGFGPGWTAVDRDEVTLALAKDDVPIEGRVLDSNGRAIAGAKVRLLRVGRNTGARDLTPWIQQVLVGQLHGRFPVELGLDTVEAQTLDRTSSATTDASGRFRLSGFGRERVLSLLVQGPKAALSRCGVATRQGPIAGAQTGRQGFYPAHFELVVDAAKPIVGTVRDKKTGKPLAGIAVFDNFEPLNRATTDAEGRYQLDGIGKQAGYSIVAETKRGTPYFGASLRVQDTPGLDPLEVDFDLERGLEINGRLVDRATREPIQGQIFYNVLRENPHRLEYANGSSGTHTRPDGSFTLIAIPGPATLIACADHPESYVFIDARKRLAEKHILGWPTAPASKLVTIDPSEDDRESLSPTIDLRPCRSVTGTVFGPDGQTVDGAYSTGLEPEGWSTFGAPGSGPELVPLKGHAFTARGFTPGDRHSLIFFHKGRKLGKVQLVTGDDAGANTSRVTVRLEALGAIEARIVDAKGRPWAGLNVRVMPPVESEDDFVKPRPEDLPWSALSQGFAHRLLQRQVTTDADGRFRAEDLLPGLPYQLIAKRAGTDDQGRPPVVVRDDVAVTSGQVIGLGELKSDSLPRDRSGTGQ